MSRPTDIEPDIYGSKDEAWAKFNDGLKDYADAVHPDLELQLEWPLTRRE